MECWKIDTKKGSEHKTMMKAIQLVHVYIQEQLHTDARMTLYTLYTNMIKLLFIYKK